jgi:3-aminobutyryl-CoA ammonia-lyase
VSLEVGFSVTHRRYVPYSHAHYGGNLVDGAYGLAMFGDVATDLAIHTDGDESLLAGYSRVEFLSPIQAGDVVEVTATLTRVGTRSRDLEFEARVLCRAAPERGPSAAAVLDSPIVATRATATIVVPAKTEGDQTHA